MRKRARSVLAGLLVLCCVVAGLVSVVRVQADSSGPAGRNTVVMENADLAHMIYPLAVSARTVAPVESPSSGPWQTAWAWIQKATHSTGAWIQKTTHSTGAFIASLSMSTRDFFVSGQALNILQTATQTITDFAVRLFLPLSVLVVPILERTVPGLSVTPELVALWMFWFIVVLALIILILALRPRHNMRKRQPRVTPRTAGQGENTIEFGLVKQGPQPSSATSLDQLARTREKQEMPPVHEPAAQPAMPEEPSRARLDLSSVPEISLEPLGFFGEAETVPTSVPDGLAAAAATIPSAVPPMLEFAPSEAEPPTAPAELSESMTATAELSSAVPADVPSEALLTPRQESSSAQESPAETLLQPLASEETSLTHGVVPVEEISVPEALVASQTGSIEEPISTEEASTPVQEEALPTSLPEINPPTRSGADLLSRLLDDEESFEQTMVAAGATAGMAAPVPPATPGSANGPTPQPAVFSGNVDLDTLLHNGVVTDAGALAQLFRGGYRNRISKLAVSAKDLQNVPEEMRQVIKLTVVALSPIELSIARDLAMRLEAPGFVGEALLVAKKMECENYLTAYKNISKNYKDVSIVDTASLKAPDISAESGEDLISFS
jgi:hypothetical protein